MRKPLYAVSAVAVMAGTSFAQASIDTCNASPEEQEIRAEMSKNPIGSLADEYRKKLDEHPGSALYLYLYGRALIGANTAEAVRQLNLAIAADPKLPWSYYALAEVYSSANFRDTGKLTDNVMAFTRLCPDVLSGYKFLGFVEDSEKLGALAVQFRRAIEDQNTSDAVANYRRLWAVEFRAADPGAFDELRKQVAKDIERIKQIDPNNTEVLREAYKLMGDSAAADAIPQKPRVPKGFSAVLMAWLKDHP